MVSCSVKGMFNRKHRCKLIAKLPRLAPLLFLKILSQAIELGFSKACSTICVTLQPTKMGCCHTTSLILGALEWWVLTLTTFNTLNPIIEGHVERAMWSPYNYTFAIIIEMIVLQLGLKSLNIWLFMLIHITLTVLRIAATMTILSWRLQPYY
jgi:hypothetical protein